MFVCEMARRLAGNAASLPGQPCVARLNSLCENSKFVASAAKQFAEKVKSVPQGLKPLMIGLALCRS